MAIRSMVSLSVLRAHTASTFYQHKPSIGEAAQIVKADRESTQQCFDRAL